MSRTILLAIGLLLGFTGTSFSDEIVINFDFGNATTYIGDDGILSSPEGNFWNRVDITNGSLSNNLLRDEFGNALSTIELGTFGGGFEAVSGTGPGPLSDGVRFGVNDPISFRTFTSPVDVVVYFVESGSVNTVEFREGLSGDSHFASTQESAFGSLFPGIEGVHYLQQTQLETAATTFGSPSLPGIAVFSDRSQGGIAAIQIRGVVGVPEPSSYSVLFFVALLCTSKRRR